MKYNIRKIWISSFELIKAKPVIILPFIIIAFFEGLTAELIYFSARKPLSFVINPIVIKFFGENFTHYPDSLFLLPKLFYYAQVLIYIFISVFLTAITINIFKNIKADLPVKADALIKNATKRYFAFFVFGVITILLMNLVNNVNAFIFSHLMPLVSKHLPQIAIKFYFIGLSLALFLLTIIVQTFIALVIPLIVIQKKSLLKAIGGSVYIGFRNFSAVFSLMFLPFLGYLPLILLKSGSFRAANKTVPEMNLYITVLGIIVAIFIDCFTVVCASQFLLDKEKAK